MPVCWAWAAALVLLVPLSAATGQATTPAPTIGNVRIGLGGAYKVGHWTPVRFTISAVDRPLTGHLELTARDGDGVPTRCIGGEIRVPAHQRREFLGYVKIGRLQGELTIQLRAEDGPALVWHAVPLTGALQGQLSTQELLVTIGQSVGLPEAIQRRATRQQESTVTSQIQQIAELPDAWYGYDGVNTLILTTSNSPIEDMDEAQLEALKQWIRMGGRCLLCLGGRGDVLLGRGQRFADLVPGQFQQVARQVSGSALENYVNATQRLEPFDMTVVSDTVGRVELVDRLRGSNRNPVIVRAPFGAGQIIFVACDLDQPPFSSWPARGQLLAAILQWEMDTGEDESPTQLGKLAHVGFDDLVGQLRSALDQFPSKGNRRGVPRVAFSFVAILIVAYLLLIGPGDYFFLKRVLRRMEWTWITFPLIVVAFCAAVYFMGQRFRGHQIRVNQVDLVDVDIDSSFVRGTTWAHIYSPRTDSYDLSLETSAAVDPADDAVGETGILFTWQGLPGRGLGGFNTTATAALFSQGYAVFSQPPAQGAPCIQQMPIQTSSTKSVLGRWWGSANLDHAAQLAERDGILEGQFTNPLNVTLRECVLMYDKWSYRIEDTLQPGELVYVSDLIRRDLEWRLTRRRMVQSDTTYATTPWDPASVDVSRIVEVMMFYQAARGATYTRLSHRYQDFVDLSQHLTTGRAILLGRANERASRIVRQDQPLVEQADRQWAFYRVVFPVQQSAARQKEPSR